MPRLFPILAVVALVAAPGVLVAPAAADTATVRGAELAQGLAAAPAVWTGDLVYLFGGQAWDGVDVVDSDDILSYDPATDTLSTLSASLPSARRDVVAVWDGRDLPAIGCAGGCAYLMGGATGQLYLDQILRFHPASGTLSTMSATLPHTRAAGSGGFDGTFAYYFAGWSADGVSESSVLRYDPLTDDVSVVPGLATFPSTTAWIGDSFLLVGVFDDGTQAWGRETRRYFPATGLVTNLTSVLPHSAWGARAVYDGTNVLVLASNAGASAGDRVLKIDPAADVTALMAAPLPHARGWFGAVWADGAAYSFGGWPQWEAQGKKIVRYDLAPGAPQGVAAMLGPGPRDATVSWSPPAADTYSHLTSYRVYRAVDTGASALVGETPADVRTFVDPALEAGRTYSYHVRAVNDGRDEGLASAVASVTTEPPAPVPAPPGLVAWWKGEDSATDSAGPHDGAAIGTLAYAEGRVGRAFRFTDSGERVSVAHHDALSFGAAEAFSIELWVKRLGANEPAHLLGKRAGCTGADINYQFLYAGGGSLSFYPGPGAGAALPLDQWTHVAAVRDGSATKLYLDGVAVASATDVGPETTADLLLGGAGGCSGFDGLLDEVSFYSRALTAQEVAAIHGAGSAGKVGPDASPPPSDPRGSAGNATQAAAEEAQRDPGTDGDASDDPDHPTPVSRYTPGVPLLGDLLAIVDEIDAYLFTLPAPGSFDVMLQPRHYVDLALNVTRPDGTWTLVDEAGPGGVEVFDAPSAAAGGYTVVVTLSKSANANKDVQPLAQWHFDPHTYQLRSADDDPDEEDEDPPGPGCHPACLAAAD